MIRRKTFAWLMLSALGLGAIGCGSDKKAIAPTGTIPLQGPPVAGGAGGEKAPPKGGKAPGPAGVAH